MRKVVPLLGLALALWVASGSAVAQSEPDADLDGFGDTTQDKCVGKAGPYAGCPNTFTFEKIAPHGQFVRVTVKVPGAGTLTAGDAADKSLVATTAKKRPLRLRKASLALSSTQQNDVTISPKLTAYSKRVLEKGRKNPNIRLTLRIKVVYTPPGGPPGSQVSPISLGHSG
jgi:hypothetical protein